MTKDANTTLVGQIARAQLQAWVVNLITLVANAYNGGLVLGAGAQLGTGKAALAPDALLLVANDSDNNNNNSNNNNNNIDAATPALVVSILADDTSADARQRLCTRYAAAGVHEYWQIGADTGQSQLFQRTADGQFERIPPDAQGLHFSSALTELAFPVAWFADQPDMWEMMDWWGLIDAESEN